MSEPARKTLAESLVAQDTPVAREKYAEYRSQLEKAMVDSSRREFRVRVTVMALWLLSFLSMMAAVWIGPVWWRKGPPEWYGVAHGVLVIVTLVETVSYFVRFLPARLRAARAFDRNLLLDLDRRLSELADRIEGAGHERPPAERE